MPTKKPRNRIGDQEGNTGRDLFKPGLKHTKEESFPSDELVQKPVPQLSGLNTSSMTRRFGWGGVSIEV